MRSLIYSKLLSTFFLCNSRFSGVIITDNDEKHRDSVRIMTSLQYEDSSAPICLCSDPLRQKECKLVTSTNVVSLIVIFVAVKSGVLEHSE